MAKTKDEWAAYQRERRAKIKSGELIPVPRTTTNKSPLMPATGMTTNNSPLMPQLRALKGGELTSFLLETNDANTLMKVAHSYAVKLGVKVSCTLIIGVIPGQSQVVQIVRVSIVGDNP